MKLSTVITSVSVAAVVTLGAIQFASAARQPDKDKAKAPAAPAAAQPDAMADMADFANPGPEHKLLAKMVGNWDCAAKFMMPGPDGKEMAHESKGRAKFTEELGGRWFRQDFGGEFMGEKFSGIGFSGYDKLKKEYTATWMDTASTLMMIMKGSYDASKKTFTWTGSFSMPGMGDFKARHTFEEKDANTFIFTMYRTGPDGKELKEGEITYKRGA